MSNMTGIVIIDRVLQAEDPILANPVLSHFHICYSLVDIVQDASLDVCVWKHSDRVFAFFETTSCCGDEVSRH